MAPKPAPSRRPSPSIHEALIDRHLARDPVTRETLHDPIIGGMYDAMRTARLAAEKAYRVADAVHANVNLTSASRHRRVREETWRIVEGSLRAMDAARDRAAREHRSLADTTSAPPRPTDAAGLMLAGEIRSRLAAMSPKERRAALDAALSDGDDVVVGAVLGGPAMLSGMASAAEHASLRERWRRTRHAETIDRMDRIDRAMQDVDRAGQLVVSLSSTLSSTEIVAAAEASEQAMERAIAE